MIKRAVGIALAAVALTGCGDDGEAQPAAAASSVEATMKDFEFEPAEITIGAGGTVTWTDEDSANHNVKFEDTGAPEGINNLQEGQSASVTFDEPGSYAFVCTYHPNMKGTVTVE